MLETVPARDALATGLSDLEKARDEAAHLSEGLKTLAFVRADETRLQSEILQDHERRINELRAWALNPEGAELPKAKDRSKERAAVEARSDRAGAAQAVLQKDRAEAEHKAQAAAAGVEVALVSIALDEVEGRRARFEQRLAELRDEAARIVAFAGRVETLAAALPDSATAVRTRARRLGYEAYRALDMESVFVPSVADAAAAGRVIDGFIERLRADPTAKFEEEI